MAEKSIISVARELGQTFLVMCAVTGLVATTAWNVFKDDITETITGDLATEVSGLAQSINALAISQRAPVLIDFLGSGIPLEPEVEQGGTINILYQLRRNASCETDIVVRLWSKSIQNYLPSYFSTIPAIKSPTTKTFNTFVVPVTVPDDLPPGDYMYVSEIRPIDCGVYTIQTGPTTQFFTVVPKEG